MTSGLWFTIPFLIALVVIFVCITVIAWTERVLDEVDGFDWDDDWDDDTDQTIYLAALARITGHQDDAA